MNFNTILLIAVIRNIQILNGAIPDVMEPDLSGLTTIFIPENTQSGVSIYNVVANDTDGHTLSYSIISGAKFSITNAGVLKTDQSASFDYEDEVDRSHIIIIQISDGVDSVNVTMTVNITDVNDNPPQFFPNNYAVTVAENTPSGTSLLELNCTDIDSESNGNCTVTIQSGDDILAKFDIYGTTLYTSVNIIDYETKNNYNLQLLGQDNPTSGSPKVASATVTVTVTGVNEAPTFSSNPTLQISENSTQMTYTYTATDPDVFPHSLKLYYIEAITNGGTDVFSIAGLWGRISLVKTLDFEIVKKYEITVVAEDYGGLQGTGTLTVSVTDVNDNIPSCTPMAHQVSVYENQLVVIPDLKCTDIDSGINSQLNYTLVVNPDNKFDLSFVGSVVAVVVNGTLDYESMSFYELEVEVSDNGFPDALSATVTIKANILDVTTITTSIKYTEFTPWIKTATGIAVTTTCVIAATGIVITAVFLIIHFCSKSSVVQPRSKTLNKQFPKTKDTITEKYDLSPPIVVATAEGATATNTGIAEYHILKTRNLNRKFEVQGHLQEISDTPSPAEEMTGSNMGRAEYHVIKTADSNRRLKIQGERSSTYNINTNEQTLPDFSRV